MREVSIGIEPDVDGGLDAQFDDAVISLRSAGCDDRFRLICRAERLQVTTPKIADQVLHLEQVVFNPVLPGSRSTFHRGSLAAGFVDNCLPSC